MSECQFCEAIAFQKAMHRTYNRESDDGAKIYHEYTVALVDRSWTKAKGKRRASRLTDYRYKGIGYELNYCPSCGTKISRRKEKK